LGTSAEEIKSKIMQLPHEELRAFREWYESFDADEWDKQMKDDAASGKLDDLAAEAISDHNSGRSKGL